MIGQTLDHYRIESKLGEGGMGVVYKARDTHLDRPVAIKVLPPDKVTDVGRKQRFVQEAKTASALNHPNIVTIYDITARDGVDFIAMEFVEGKTLDELIPAKGLRPAQAIKYAVQMADALAKAHGAGILHRDVKPSNVIITDEGRIKILDFGLAKLLEPPDSSPEAATLTVLPQTEEGHVVGSVPYMSPEQAEGRKLDGRSDIFSFGSVLYEMVTGRKPFTGDSRLSLMTKIVNEAPNQPSQVAASIPVELEKIILRCMRKDPARRYQYMADVKVALEDVEEESASGERVAVVRPRRRWVWSALLPVMLAGGYFAWQRWRAPQPAEPLRAVALTTLPGAEFYPSISPDGNHVGFTWTGPKQDNPDIYVQQIGSSGSPLRLTTDPRIDFSPAWSPDGRWIAFLRQQQAGQSELRLIPPLGGTERKLIDVRGVGPGFGRRLLAWCPDSTCLVFVESPGLGKASALFAVSLDSGERRQLTYPKSVLADTSPAISADGRSLVFRREAGSGAGELYWVPLAKGMTADTEPKRLTIASQDAEHPAWMPDGKEILFSARGSVWRQAVAREGPGARLPFVGEDGSAPVVSRSQPGRPSRLVYVRSSSDLNIWRVETSAPGTPTLLSPVVAISSTRLEENPQFSPDGRRVAFACTRSEDMEIWVSDPDGANAVQLTSQGARNSGHARWSPDGATIVFGSNAEGQYEIYSILATGAKPRRLTSHPAMDYAPSFSRDGKWVYFNSNRAEGTQIWKIPAIGGDAVQITHSGGSVPFESPDGAYVYYSMFGTELWRVPASGGQPSKVLEGVNQRNFVVLPTGIYYIGGPASDSRLQFFDLATGKSTTIAPNLGIARLGLTATADGRTILYTRQESSVDDLMLVENFR